MKIKVLQIGNYAVGKTYILSNYLGKSIIGTSPTVGVEFNCLFTKLNEQEVKIHFWDCAGSDRFRSIIKSYYSICDIFLIYFNANNIHFRDEINKWINEIKMNLNYTTKILLIANSKRDINHSLKEAIDDYLLESNLDCVFVSEYSDFGKVIKKIINIYSEIDRSIKEQSNIKTPLLRKKKSNSCLSFIFPCI